MLDDGCRMTEVQKIAEFQFTLHAEAIRVMTDFGKKLILQKAGLDPAFLLSKESKQEFHQKLKFSIFVLYFNL